jgi:hypothetical protein
MGALIFNHYDLSVFSPNGLIDKVFGPHQCHQTSTVISGFTNISAQSNAQ